MQELVSVRARVGAFPWLTASDFNVIRSHQEKLEFVDCINRLEIEDLAFTGLFHTWSNKQVGENFVSKKLDRVHG